MSYKTTKTNKYQMSLSKNKKLRLIAKVRCKELRKNSTNAENIFWEIVRNRKFGGKKFYRQYPIFFDLQGKETFFIADFYCHAEKLVIELDGNIHNYTKEQDRLRTEIINLLGIRVIRFKNEEIEHNIESVLLTLKNYLTHLKTLS